MFMFKYIYHLTIFSNILLLYGCSDFSKSKTPRAVVDSNVTEKNASEYTASALTTEEQMNMKKLHLLLYSINFIYLNKNLCNDNDNVKCTDFIEWLKDKSEEKQELDNAFTAAYDFLESRRQKYASNKTLEEYIKDALLADYGNNKEGKYGNNNLIYQFFIQITLEAFPTYRGDNVNIFESLKRELLNQNPDSHVQQLITSDF